VARSGAVCQNGEEVGRDGGSDRVLVAARVEIEHTGSAHDDAELAALKAAARQWLGDGREEIDLGLEVTEAAGQESSAARCRSRPRGCAACWTPSSGLTRCSGEFTLGTTE
jgi:hypothetical protein